jgi:hypothetical protein
MSEAPFNKIASAMYASSKSVAIEAGRMMKLTSEKCF